MPIYYGKSKDGSDMKEFEGFHWSPNRKYWGSEPISKEEEKKIEKELEGTFTQRLFRKTKNKKPC